MYGDDVGEPEQQAGNFVRKDFLNFAAENLPFFAIHFGANLIDQRVDARIAVVSALGAVGRKALRGKNKFEDVGIVVGADPTRIGELKIASCRVGEKAQTRRRERVEAEALTGRGIGDFTENGGGVRAGGAGEITGSVMEGFVGEQGEREGFFGVFRDAQAGRWNDFDPAESG